MRRNVTLAAAAVATLAVSPFLGVGAASAADGDTMANLQPVALNGVQASGTAMVQVNGTTIDVTMAASGLLPDNPHAAHIHFGADARHECPTAGDDADGSGTINTTDGDPAYGPIVVSLTKTGDQPRQRAGRGAVRHCPWRRAVLRARQHHGGPGVGHGHCGR